MFTIQKDEVCACCRKDAEELKARMVTETERAALVEFAIGWWDRHLRALNPDTSKVSAFMRVMRSDLYAWLYKVGLSEKVPIGLGVGISNCGVCNGPLATYAVAAGVDITLPEGFEPGGRTMLITPNAMMIVKRIWRDEADCRGEGLDTEVKEFISYKDHNPVIPAAAMWLRDYVVDRAVFDDPDATSDEIDKKEGDLDELYRCVATRLCAAKPNADAITWKSKDFLSLFRAAKCLVPAPQNTIMRIEKKKVSILTPGTDDEFVIFEMKDA